MHPDSFPLLGFCWPNEQGVPVDYYFRVLPFGLSSAPAAFTRLTRALVRRWRSRGLRLLHYLDDFGGGDTPERASASVGTMVSDLGSAGFMINWKKSHLTPTTVLPHLGTLFFH